MVKRLPEWFTRAESMKVHEVIVVELPGCDVQGYDYATKQRVILNNLAKIPGKFRTRRIVGVGYKIERMG